MLIDTLIVFFEVCVILVLVIAVVWGFFKVLGYIAMAFEGEPLVNGIRRDVAMTQRQVKRTLSHGVSHGPRPTA